MILPVSVTPRNAGFSASPMHIYGRKMRIFDAAHEGSNASAYSSIGKRKMPRMLRPSVRVGAIRPNVIGKVRDPL